MNQLTLLGRLGKDPEMRDAGSTKVISASLAIDSSYTNKQGERVKETEWINFKAFGRTAEVIHQYFKKGDRILVTGSFKTDTWEAQGVKKYSSYCLVRGFEFIETAGNNQAQREPSPADGPNDDLPF